MDIPTKKLKCGFEMPVFGLGTWMMGGDKDRDPNNNDARDIEVIQMHIENGVNHIFTAQNYADGYCEKLVGRAIESYKRDELILSTAIRKENSRKDDVVKSFEKSLKSLKTDYVDILYHHARDVEVPVRETVEAMMELKEKGNAKEISVSNYGLESLKEAQKVSGNAVRINQVYYNPQVREAETSGLLKYCQEKDVFFMAYRPFGKGNLLKNDYEMLEQLAEKYNKTPSQIILNWLVTQKIVITISTTWNLDHLKENLNSFDWEMEKSDIELIRKNFPNQIEIGECGELR